MFEQLEKELQEEIKLTGATIREGEFTTYRTILHEGDLPGDQGLEWWTQEDWDKHAKHVEELKAKGTYGKPWICELTLKHMPEYDTPSWKPEDNKLESYRFVMVDFSK